MRENISERDWKVFKKVHPLAIERFAHGSVSAIRRELVAVHPNDHQRFWGVFNLCRARHEKMKAMFDDYRRSTAVLILAAFRYHGLVTDMEMAEFSEETQEHVRRFVELRRGADAEEEGEDDGEEGAGEEDDEAEGA